MRPMVRVPLRSLIGFMAKKKAEIESSGGDVCPGCKKRCMYLKQWPNGAFIATHKIGTVEVVGKYGFNYTIKTALESCNETGAIHRHCHIS